MEVLEAQAKHFYMCFKYQDLFQAFEEEVLKLTGFFKSKRILPTGLYLLSRLNYIMTAAFLMAAAFV